MPQVIKHDGVLKQDMVFSGCAIEHDIDYHGNDIVNKVLENIQACADMCASTSGGQFWTWKVADKTCYVKSSNAGALEHDHVISGSRKCGSMRLGGKYNVILFAKW